MSVILANAPSECSPEQLAAFAELVRQGGEVMDDGLEGRIAHAHRLAFCFDKKEAIGIAAIKNPENTYRAKVSRKSGQPLERANWPFELGWVFVAPWARKGGVGRAIVQAAIVGNNAGIFATARTDNEGMSRLLEHLQFRPVGDAYASDRPGHQIQLFLRG